MHFYQFPLPMHLVPGSGRAIAYDVTCSLARSVQAIPEINRLQIYGVCIHGKPARSPSLRKQEGLFVSHIFRDTNNPSVTCRYVWAFQN